MPEVKKPLSGVWTDGGREGWGGTSSPPLAGSEELQTSVKDEELLFTRL